jgi:hypothetical protein
MVKIENIIQDGNIITIDCYEEGDKSRGHHVVFDIDTWQILNGITNNIYIRQSIARIGTLFEENKQLPKEACSYWY